MILRRPQIKAACQALGFELAGEYEGDSKIAHQAQAALCDVPRGGVMIGFSNKELGLLWHVLLAGVESLQPGEIRPDQRKTFNNAANRIKEAREMIGTES